MGEGSTFSAALKKANGGDSFWANQLLTTKLSGPDEAGIDFNANAPESDDPDQLLAELYHDPFACAMVRRHTGVPGQHKFSSPFFMSPSQSQAEGKEWAPGQLKSVPNRFGSIGPYYLPMRKEADGKILEIRGGLSIRGEIKHGWFSDPDPVPLEAIRGPNSKNSQMMNGEDWGQAVIRGGPPNTRERHIASVIPVKVDIRVPEGGGGIMGRTKYFYAKTADPLVNKFPGDWKPLPGVNPESDTPPSGPTAIHLNDSLPYDEWNNFRNDLADPDSYWLPQADCGVSRKDELASQTLIPRSARMPNVGYLQYVRTGIMPDDESVAYENQHGTPFRLLSFAPSTTRPIK